MAARAMRSWLRITDTHKQLAAVPIRCHQWHGEWNYSILPQAAWQAREATLACKGPSRFLPVAGLCLTGCGGDGGG